MHIAAFHLYGGGHFEVVLANIHLWVTIIPGSQIYYEIFMLHDYYHV